MSYYFDLHRHDEFSFFDGFGKPVDLASHAKELGYTALGSSNHGNISGLIQHWLACKAVEIKPILGCEVYFQPKFNKENPKRKSYHLCLFAKNLTGYKNLCHILTYANKNQFYYKPIVDFRLLRKYHDGLICSTACIASATSQAIVEENDKLLGRLFDKFLELFGEDLYIEIQPYKIDDEHTQEKVNARLFTEGQKRGIKCILTSDSHYGSKEDFDTYLKMHEIGKTTLDVRKTYSERYMPTEKQIIDRFVQMHTPSINGKAVWSIPASLKVAKQMVKNLQELQDKVEADYLSELELNLPKIDDSNVDSYTQLKNMVKDGLKKKGKFDSIHKKRCKEELDVIHYHGFDDYFLMVQDYVNFARKNGIIVGRGRGSACNCEVAEAIGITDVDSIQYKLDFSRFMRKEKKKMPDIDVDFQKDRRQEVIDYVVNKYKGRAVRICSYGEYQTDMLVNDLSKVCGLETTGKDLDEYDKRENKKVVAEIKSFIHNFEIDGELDKKALQDSEQTKEYNRLYDNIIKHFCKMYGKIRQLGRHACGVAIVGTDISDYTAVVKSKDLYTSAYDLSDLEHINCIKFDMLGLRTLSELKDLREYTGVTVDDNMLQDSVIYDNFREGNTTGIFQMEKSTPKKILNLIHCDCMNDVIAVNALNRPAPLQLKMHETYAHNKLSNKIDRSTPYYKYTQETYGTMLYQEQTVEVAQKVGHLTANQSFDMLKIMKKEENLRKAEYIPIIEEMRKDFYKGCKQEKLSKEETEHLWKSMLIYGFNKGHSTGYALISIEQMYYKVYYSPIFWFVKIKYAPNDFDVQRYCSLAVKDGCVILIPHINFESTTSLGEYNGEKVIRQGLECLKGVGVNASKAIEDERKKHGKYIDLDDFLDRMQGNRAVHRGVIETLYQNGALQFDEETYMKKVVQYNSSLVGRI